MFKLDMTDYDQHIYNSELMDFLPDKMIDFHTHIGKASFEAQGKSNGGSTWTRFLSDELTVENLNEGYLQLFPKQQVVPLVFGDCVHNIRQVNDYTCSAGVMHQFPTLYRTSYDMEPEWLEQEINSRGFLGLKPYLSNCPPYIPVNELRIFDFLPEKHLEVANRNGWIVMLHIPRSARLKDALNLAQIMQIEEAYPNVKLVVAHIGRAYSREDVGDAFTILGNTKNLVFDFTANLCDDAIEACLEAVGTDRLLFGSDLPIAVMRMYRIVDNGTYYNVVPKGLYGDMTGEPHMIEKENNQITLMIYEQLLAFKRVAQKMNLTEQQIEAVLYGNAKRILNETGWNYI